MFAKSLGFINFSFVFKIFDVQLILNVYLISNQILDNCQFLNVYQILDVYEILVISQILDVNKPLTNNLVYSTPISIQSFSTYRSIETYSPNYSELLRRFPGKLFEKLVFPDSRHQCLLTKPNQPLWQLISMAETEAFSRPCALK